MAKQVQTKQCFSNLHLPSFSKPVPNLVSDYCAWLPGVEPDVAFCFFNPSASRFVVLRCNFAHLVCKEWLVELPYIFCHLTLVC